MAIFAEIDFRGLKYPPEVLVELNTCSAICGTHVHTILNHKDLTGSAEGVREGQNTEQYGAIGRVDLGSGLKKIRPSGNCEL